MVFTLQPGPFSWNKDAAARAGIDIINAARAAKRRWRDPAFQVLETGQQAENALGGMYEFIQ